MRELEIDGTPKQLRGRDLRKGKESQRRGRMVFPRKRGRDKKRMGGGESKAKKLQVWRLSIKKERGN